jgi:ornithine carbamoyltransferase
LRVAFVGDGRNNVCNSLMLGCAKAGLDFVNCCPGQLAPEAGLVAHARQIAAGKGSEIVVDPDPGSALAGANVVYTDVWVSMGEESAFQERVELLRPYRVDMAMMESTGNLGSGRVMFLHCLPALHNRETETTREIGALEVDDDVFEAPFSKVFDEAENRMHTIKAMMVASLQGVR